MFTSAGRRTSCSQPPGAIASRFGSSRRGHPSFGPAAVEETRLQWSAASCALGTGEQAGHVSLSRRRDLGEPGRPEDREYLQHGESRATSGEGASLCQKKVVYKKCHSFTFGLLITPSGIRIPFEIPHYTKEYCAAYGHEHRTTAEAAADMIRSLPLPAECQSGGAGRYGLRCRRGAEGLRGRKDTRGSFRPIRNESTKDRRANVRSCVLV